MVPQELGKEVTHWNETAARNVNQDAEAQEGKRFIVIKEQSRSGPGSGTQDH